MRFLPVRYWPIMMQLYDNTVSFPVLLKFTCLRHEQMCDFNDSFEPN